MEHRHPLPEHDRTDADAGVGAGVGPCPATRIRPDPPVPAAGIGRSYRVDAVSAPDFDRIAAGFEDLCADQVAGYKAVEQPGRTSLFVSYRNGEPIGGAVIVVYALPWVGRGIANIRFGPFWRRRGRAADIEDCRAVVDQLVGEYAVRRGLTLTILPRPDPEFQEAEGAVLTARGFTPRDAAGSVRYLVDLTLSPEAQMQSLSQKWRYNLRQALKRDLSVERSDRLSAYDDFVALHGVMQKRKGLKLDDHVHAVAAMRRTLPPERRPAIYFVRYQGRIVSGAVVAALGDTAYYLFGASTDEALPLRAGYALQWHVIEQLRAAGCARYDLGGSSQFDGLRQFKSGLTGRGGRIVDLAEEYDFAATRLAELGGSSINALRHLRRRWTYLRNRL